MKKEFVEIKRAELLARVREITTKQYHLSSISGSDIGNGVELLYHFDLGEKFTTLKLLLKNEDKTVPSITPLVPAATIYEREFSEMFGVKLEGHPTPGRIFLPENYVGEPPLLKKTRGDSSD